MNIETIQIKQEEMRKLLGAGSGDAALLYLYIQCSNDPSGAESALNMTQTRFECAAATLRQLGLWPDDHKKIIFSGERPAYSERDIVLAMDTDDQFRLLYGEVQRVLGRTLNTEELKILLGFIRYLGLPVEVISVLVCYCKDRARQRGNLRNPSLRTIEKEAYAWAEQGIDTLEEAAAFIQTQNARNSRISNLKRLLQIQGRRLTPAEERFALSWLDMGFEDDAITLAYEKTCLNTGGLKWPYMNSILTRWHQADLHTAEQVRTGDHKPAPRQTERQLDADEQAAIARMMQEG